MTITRRATLAALTASPLTIASVATQAAPGGEGQSPIEKLYCEWANARAEIASIEAEFASHGWNDETTNRRFDAQDAIAAQPCRHERDVWIKLAVALDNFPYAPDDNILLSLRAEAMRLVNLPDVKTT